MRIHVLGNLFDSELCLNFSRILHPRSTSELPHIAELIIDGEITVGTLVPVGCVAIATDGHNTLAMLKRRGGETLAQLLTRLDLAFGKAFTQDVFTDEINTPQTRAADSILSGR